VTVGPTGVWIIDNSNVWHNKSTVACNDGSPWNLVTNESGLTIIKSGSTGIYYLQGSVIRFLSTPAGIPVPVPAGGPTNPVNLSASTLDNSLAVFDSNTNRIWILSGPSGTWT
jgi:hypothetical protein